MQRHFKAPCSLLLHFAFDVANDNDHVVTKTRHLRFQVPGSKYYLIPVVLLPRRVHDIFPRKVHIELILEVFFLSTSPSSAHEGLHPVAGNTSLVYYIRVLGICLVVAQVEAINRCSHNKLISARGFGLFAIDKSSWKRNTPATVRGGNEMSLFQDAPCSLPTTTVPRSTFCGLLPSAIRHVRITQIERKLHVHETVRIFKILPSQLRLKLKTRRKFSVNRERLRKILLLFYNVGSHQAQTFQNATLMGVIVAQSNVLN